MKYMTKEWYAACQMSGRPPFDETSEGQIRTAVQAYRNLYKSLFPTPPPFMKTVDRLHDCEILSAGLRGNDYVIVTDNGEWGVDGCTRTVLKDAAVKKQDFSDQPLAWCYHELYPAAHGFELHVLFYEYGSQNVYELIAECRDIEIIPGENGGAPCPTSLK